MLRVKDIHTFYGSTPALFGVSLEVNEGEIVTLIGGNGAGKSTTLKSISGLLVPRSGTITFCGETITGLAPYRIVEMGIAHCPEGRRVWPSMTVYENLELGAYVRRDAKGVRADIRAMFEYFPILQKRQQQLAGSLSGGEQQMLAIARSLMSKPKLLLLDEPSLGLSPIMVEQVAQIVKEINQRGTSVLLVEQNAAVALSLASRAYVLETGKVVLAGATQDLRDNSYVRSAYLGG